MQWMLARRLLSTTVLLLLALGSTSGEQKEKLQLSVNTPGSFMSSISDWLNNVAPTSSVTDDMIGLSSICSLLFDIIGPFCQYVVSGIEPEGGMCQPGLSMETCDNCQLMVQLCGTRDDIDLDSICMSDLAPFCAANDDPEIDPLIADYCSIVQRVCGNGLVSGSGIVSGSGSGSGFSGSGSGSGVEPTVPPTTGNPGPTTTSEPTTSVPITTTTPPAITTTTTGNPGPTTTSEPTTSVPITTTTPPAITTTTTTSTDTGGTLMTTTATVPTTFTTMIPIVLVTLEDLSEQQRENVVTVQFTGLNEEQFLNSAITIFRMEVAVMVNDFLLNPGQNRKKRQASPAQVSPDDVIVIEPLRVVNGELSISFVVGGRGGQSAPVSGTAVASLLQMEGPMLAMTLSNTIGQSVQFVDVFITTTTDTTSEIPKVQQLSSGAIAGIVISVLIVVILVVAVVVVAIIALVLGYRNSGGMKLNLKRQSQSLPQSYIQVSRHEDSRFASEWQSVPMNEYVDHPATKGNGGTNEHTEL